MPCLDLAACVPTKLSFPSVNSTQPFFAQPGWVNYETKVEFMNNFSKQIGQPLVESRRRLRPPADVLRQPDAPEPGHYRVLPRSLDHRQQHERPVPAGLPDARASSDRLPSPASSTVDAWSHKAFYFAGFAQDDWKVSPRLTLNLGLRYDLEDLVQRLLLGQQPHLQGPQGHRPSVRRAAEERHQQPGAAARRRLRPPWRRQQCAARQLRRLLRHRDHHLCLLLEPRAAGDGVRAVDHCELGDRLRGRSRTMSTA